MSTTNDPRDLRELLGAYALGAVDAAEEREQLDALVRSDAEARAELRGYQRATALLHSEDGPSDAVWHRIEEGMLDTEVAPPSGTASLVERRWRRRAVRVGVAAVAAAALLALALWGRHLTSQSLPTQPASNLRHAASAVAAQPGSRRLELVSNDGQIRLSVLVGADGRAFLLSGQLRGVHPGRTLVLVATTASRTVVLHVVDPTLRIVEFRLPADARGLVLREAAGPGRRGLDLAQSPLPSGCSGPCPASGRGTPGVPPTPTPSTGTPTPAPSPPSGAPLTTPKASGGGSRLLPPITLPPLPQLPGVPLP